MLTVIWQGLADQFSGGSGYSNAVTIPNIKSAGAGDGGNRTVQDDPINASVDEISGIQPLADDYLETN